MPYGAHRMDAADEPADPFQHLRILEVRRAPAAARVDREHEAGELPVPHGCDHRDLALRELAREGVLFLDLLAGPARLPVELEDDGNAFCGAFVQPDLVDAVLVAVQPEQTSVGT